MIFDYDTLLDLFETEGEDFSAWIEDSGYNPSSTDEWIYTHLPQEIKEGVTDWVLNASWYHEGM